MQENAFRFCNINYMDFWTFTPAETTKMIIIAAERDEQAREYSLMLNSRVLAVMMTANDKQKSNKQPFDVQDFMPEKETQKPRTAEQYEQMAKMVTLAMGGTVTE